MGEHVATTVQLIMGQHVFSTPTIRGTFVQLAPLPGVPTLKKTWPAQAMAMSLAQKNSLQTLVYFVCVYSLYSRFY